MAYNALIKMAQKNKKLYGVNDRPHIPDPASFEPNSFQESAIAFIRNTCEDLRFDSASTVYKDKKSQLERIEAFDDSTGRSYSDRQIPYYMQMDIDRLCLERTLSDFLKEGTSQGAFLVYYCYLEMFWRENSEGPRKMIEMLSAFEQNASPLIHSHRDHFVHSVNVFAIGLAIYQQSSIFRQGYMEHYHLANPQMFTPFRKGRQTASHGGTGPPQAGMSTACHGKTDCADRRLTKFKERKCIRA